MYHYFQMLTNLEFLPLPTRQCLVLWSTFPTKAYPPLPGSLDYPVLPGRALSFPVSASLLLRLPLPSTSFPVEILQPVQLLNSHSTLSVLLGFIVCFASVVYVPVGLFLNFQLLEAGDWQSLPNFLLHTVSTWPAQNRSPINVSWIGFNTLLAATLLCPSCS